MRKILLIPFAMLALFASCGSGDASKGTEQSAVNGPHSYDFKINNSCSGDCDEPQANQRCEAKQSFSSLKDYCDGLRNDKLNDSCARIERKAQYLAACGSTFEDTNVVGGWQVGDREENCHSSQGVFETRTQYCADLMDDSRHQGCATKDWIFKKFKLSLAKAFDC